jgi:putative flippase GtrA
MRRSRQWWGQLARFGVVGVASNLALYPVFLLLLHLGLHSTAAMTVTYAMGMLQTYLLQRGWTFRHAGRASRSAWRYALLYGAGYLLNFLLLYWLSDGMGLPAPYVQAGAIFVVAGMLFLVQKFWVFGN